jgi:L-ascorbate metabolism protein UlaG (beta-lactamase superfamily)
MRRLAVFLALFFTISPGLAETDPGVDLLYVANEGFLIEIGSKKILIDALFDDDSMTHCHVPKGETLAHMRNSDPPFDDIDLILVTHSHRDHFSPESVLKHLDSDPSSILIAPPQAIAQLRSHSEAIDKYGKRIKEIDLDLFESTELTLSGIRLQTHRIRHSEFMETDEKTGKQVNRHQDIENFSYLVEYADVALLHVGDAILPLNREYFEAEPFSKKKLDLVFLEFFDWSDETKEILQLSMKPDHIVFMHLPPVIEKIEQYTRHLSEKFSNAVIFKEQMQHQSF